MSGYKSIVSPRCVKAEWARPQPWRLTGHGTKIAALLRSQWNEPCVKDTPFLTGTACLRFSLIEQDMFETSVNFIQVWGGDSD